MNQYEIAKHKNELGYIQAKTKELEANLKALDREETEHRNALKSAFNTELKATRQCDLKIVKVTGKHGAVLINPDYSKPICFRVLYEAVHTREYIELCEKFDRKPDDNGGQKGSIGYAYWNGIIFEEASNGWGFFKFSSEVHNSARYCECSKEAFEMLLNNQIHESLKPYISLF